MFDTTLGRSLLLLCIGSGAMCAAMGLWYCLSPAPGAGPAFGLDRLWRPEFAYAVAVTALGGFLNGFTGFGSSLVMIPLLAIVYGPAEAIAVGIGLAALGYALLFPDAVRDADWPDVVPAGLAGLAFVPVGLYLLFAVDPGVTRRLMGAVVVVVALVMIRGWSYDGPRNTWTSAAAGSVTGFTTGFFGMGAPGVSVYYLSAGVRAAVRRANILAVLGVMAPVTMAGVGLAGGADRESLVLGLALIPSFALPTWLGARAFRRASDEIYRRACLWLLVVMGLAVVVL